MIPIPTHLREMAENADGHGEKLRFFLRCPCGETLFSLEESNLSPKEKAAERAHEKAVKTLFSRQFFMLPGGASPSPTRSVTRGIGSRKRH